MMTLHPCGFSHGPHPKALRNIYTPKAPGTNEVAVNIDARDPLDLSPAASSIEWSGYVDSWRAPAE